MKYYYLSNILNEDECNNLINDYEEFLTEEFELFDYKNNRYDFKNVDLSNTIFQKIKNYINKINNENNINIVEVSYKWYATKYLHNSGFISKHYDGNIEYDNLISKYTLLIYLNDNFDEGKTIIYDEQNNDTEITRIIPKKGNILILDQDIYHSGAKCFNGCKYILRSDLMVKK